MPSRPGADGHFLRITEAWSGKLLQGEETEAQEARWGAEDTSTIFRRMMRETQRARDASGWHTPDQNLMAMEGDNRVDELAAGRSRIGEVPSERLLTEAWDRITRG